MPSGSMETIWCCIPAATACKIARDSPDFWESTDGGIQQESRELLKNNAIAGCALDSGRHLRNLTGDSGALAGFIGCDFNNAVP